jgi:hypothetical protein
MKQMKYICDICKKEIPTRKGLFITTQIRGEEAFCKRLQYEDICEKCIKKVVNTVKKIFG